MSYNFRFMCFRMALTVLICLMTGSCIEDASDCPETSDPGLGTADVRLSFTIMTGREAARTTDRSRSADIDGDQNGKNGENYIDINDLNFLLFDADGKFLQNFTPETKVIRDPDEETVYTVNATVSDPYFGEATGDNVVFYIMALCNGAQLGMGFPLLERGTTIESLCSAAGSPSFTILPQTSILQWGIPGMQSIPMSGLRAFSVSKAALKASSADNPVDISEARTKPLNMLRAVTKIEIVDKINIEGKYNPAIHDNLPERIEKVEINGIYPSGTILPSMDQWTRNVAVPETQQVIAPTIPVSAAYLNPAKYPSPEFTQIIPGTSLDFVPDGTDEDNCPVYAVYIYEYAAESFIVDGSQHNVDNGIKLTEQMPYIRVTIGTDILPMRLATYKDGIAEAELPYMLRNHIYRFEITKIHLGSELTVNWTVCDMDNGGLIEIPGFD